MVASYILPMSEGWKKDQLSSPQVDVAKQAESKALASDGMEIWKVKPPKGWGRSLGSIACLSETMW